MIRLLVVVLGLLTGLGLALCLGGQIGHLRATGLEPGWMRGFDAAAGLREGHGQVSGSRLHWRLEGIDLLGPRWVAALDGADWHAQAVVRADWNGLWLEAVRGLVPGALLVAGGEGFISVQEGALMLRLPAPAWFEGRLLGVARGLRLGAVQAEGPVSLTVANGEWSR